MLFKFFLQTELQFSPGLFLSHLWICVFWHCSSYTCKALDEERALKSRAGMNATTHCTVLLCD